MIKVILKRLASLPITVLLASFLVFGLVALVPGDAAYAIAGESATPELLAEIRSAYGLDQPFIVQYGNWLGHIFGGDLGQSFQTRQPVGEVLMSRLPVTVSIMLISMILAIVVGLLLGVIGGSRQGTKTDRAITGVTILGIAVPEFWLGMVFVAIFAVQLRMFPSSGFPGWDAGPGAVSYLVLPCITIAIHIMALIARQTRAGVAEISRSDFIRTHRAMGRSAAKITWVHALKNASLPVLTIIGLQGAHLLGGTVVIETVFGIPGLGSLVASSARDQDYPIVVGAVLLMGLMVIVVNLIVDIAYRTLDPRVRLAR